MDGPELEWNAASHRVQYVSQLRVAVRQAFAQAYRNRTQEHVQDYFATVNVLYEELQVYLDDDTRTAMRGDLQQLEDKVNDGNAKTVANQFSDIRSLDRKLQRKCKEVGLDIPSKTDLDPENAFTQGHT